MQRPGWLAGLAAAILAALATWCVAVAVLDGGAGDAMPPGWEEIDCVELIGGGRSQWAATATATSSYAD